MRWLTLERIMWKIKRGSEAGVASEVTAMGTGCERRLRAFSFHVITSDYLDEHIFVN